MHDPYNLYFTPNGRYAVVMASLDRELVFRDPHTMKTIKTEPVACYGVNHADFSPDGRYFIVSCEFSGELLKVDTEKMKVVGSRKLPFDGAMPQDVKISPDGKRFYIADMMADGVWVLDGDKFTEPTLLPTGKGTHGLYVSRDSREMYVSNRGEGTISVFDFATEQADQEVAPARRRQPGHGRCLRRRQGPVAVRALQRRGVRHRHPHRRPARPHPGRQRPARPRGVPAAGPLLAGPHRHLPLTYVLGPE